MVERKAGIGNDGLRKTKGGAVKGDESEVHDKPVKGSKGGRNMNGAGSDSSVEVVFKNDDIRRIDFVMGAIEAIENHYPDKNTWNPTTPISMILRWQRGGFGMSWSQLKVFLWAGLLWEDREIKLTDLDTMMDLKRVKYYSEQVDEALKLAFGITDEDIAAAQKAMEEGNAEAAQKNGISIGEI